MKKVLLLVAMVCMGFFANAQFYAGGSLGLGFSTVKNDNGDKIGTTSGFFINPEVGYSLNDKIDVGLHFGFGTIGYKPDGGDKSKTTMWEVAPYLRYSIVEFGKFKILGKAKLYVEGAGKDEFLLETGEYTEFGLNIAPMLTYDLSDKFVLFTDLNFLSFDFFYHKEKDANSTTGLRLGVDANDAYNVGAITVGFAYKF